MTPMLNPRSLVCLIAFTLVLLAQSAAPAAAAPPAQCTKIVLTGQAVAGQEWRQPIGQGWVFRLVPVAPGRAAYTGWDLVVDRDPPAGFPDALLLATPPYNSISEREIATTFGLRAQDALGWNPRSFRFFTSPADLLLAQKLYAALHMPSAAQSNPAYPAQRLMALQARSSAGQFRILDARIAPGTADAVPFAQAWALQSARTPHTVDPSSTATPRGAFQSIRFSITLWLPAGWRAPRELQSAPAACQP